MPSIPIGSVATDIPSTSSAEKYPVSAPVGGDLSDEIAGKENNSAEGRETGSPISLSPMSNISLELLPQPVMSFDHSSPGPNLFSSFDESSDEDNRALSSTDMSKSKRSAFNPPYMKDYTE